MNGQLRKVGVFTLAVVGASLGLLLICHELEAPRGLDLCILSLSSLVIAAHGWLTGFRSMLFSLGLVLLTLGFGFCIWYGSTLGQGEQTPWWLLLSSLLPGTFLFALDGVLSRRHSVAPEPGGR